MIARTGGKFSSKRTSRKKAIEQLHRGKARVERAQVNIHDLAVTTEHIPDAMSSYRFPYAENIYGRFADRWDGLPKMSQKPAVRDNRGTPLTLTLSPEERERGFLRLPLPERGLG